MENDLTLLYYTSNQIPEVVAERIRLNLLLVTECKYPIISVSQKPLDFGKNICVGEIGVSKYNEYKQILIGLKEVKTKYVACIEDDTLYPKEHFDLRPPEDCVGFENNYWFAQLGKDFYWRVGDISKRGGMWGCISTTKHLFNNLSTRYNLYPNISKIPPFWGEPAYCDEQFGMENKKVYFNNPIPAVIFINAYSMGGVQLARFRRRYGDPKPEDKCESLDGYGKASDLIKRFWD